MKSFANVLLALLITGCSDPVSDERVQSNGEENVASELAVAVVGGDTSEAFAEGVRSAGFINARASSSADVAQRASLLSSSDVAIILVDATQGPLPINREDILLFRQFCPGTVVVGFSRSAMVDDPELLELEELEMRELLNVFDLPGDTVAVCFDSESARTNLPNEFSEVSKVLSQLESVQLGGTSPISIQQIDASLYALTDQESFRRGIARPISTGTYRVILGDQFVEADLRAETTVQPGSSGVVTLRFSETVDVQAGSRFVVGSPDHVLAAGTFMPISPQ